MAQTSEQFAEAEGAPATLPAGFSSGEVEVNGAALHYVRGGDGPAIILLHGFPQDWTEYRSIMPQLAAQFTVVSIDLPGVGKSAPSATGYDTAHMAADIHALTAALNIERPYLVGHDLGGLTAYAYLRQFPDDLRGVMVLDVPVSGLRGTEQASANFWHIRFIQVPGEFAEKLVFGRQDVFLGWSLAMGAFTPAQREYYTQLYGAPQIHAAFEIYRAFPANAEYNAARTEAIETPVVVAVGEKSFFAEYLATFVDAYHEKGVRHVESTTIPDAGHYLLADNPQAVADLIEKYASR